MKAKEILSSFIAEMKEYEIKWSEKYIELDYDITDVIKENQLKDIVEIQDRYLSQKALSFEQDRRFALNFGMPPQYDQEIQEINEKTPKKVEFITKSVSDNLTRYTLILEDDEWKLDMIAFEHMNWKNSRKAF